MKKKILTVTLNPAIDYTVKVANFVKGSVNRADSSRYDVGGKGINVATALVQGGFDCSVTGFLGLANCDIFKRHFNENCIIDNFIYIDGTTREGIKITDMENSQTTDVNLPGFSISSSDLLLFKEKFREIIVNFDYVILSGSLPIGVPTNIYSELSGIAHNSQVFVAVDSSGEALKESVQTGYVDLIKPNEDELFDKIPILLENVNNILLSLGEKGSRLYADKKIYSVTAPEIDLKSSVGAGDALLAGYISGLAQNLNNVECLKNATSWAASKLTIYGAGLSTIDPPENYITRVVVIEDIK